MNDFFANIYELGGFNYIEGLSDDLYDNGVYPLVFWISLGVSIFLLVVYYKILDQPKFSKVIYWLLFFALIIFLSGFIAYSLADTTIYNLYADQGQDIPYYMDDFMSFAATNVVLFLIITFISSLIFKLFSTNHKYIPF